MSTSIHPNAPFRADIVGSFLRPQAVKDARVAYAAGTLDAAGLKAVEDEAIRDLVDKRPPACRSSPMASSAAATGTSILCGG